MRQVLLAGAIAVLASALHARADDATQRLDLPGDVEAMIGACRDVHGLQTFMRNGYLSIECGNQAILLGQRVPIGPAPHVAWAKPYARGPIKMLIVCGVGYGPTDVAQLAQVTRELDTDVRWLLVADAAVTTREADELYRTQFLPEQARAALAHDYDVIVMTFGTVTPSHGYPPEHGFFPDDVYQSILSHVKRGAGLVLVGQNAGGFWVNQTPLANALPAHMTGGFTRLVGEDVKLEPTPGTTTFGTLALDPSAYTTTRPLIVYDWKLRPDATVLARIGERPVIMTRDHGKGRVVLLGWDGTLNPQDGGSSRTELEHGTALALRAITFAAHKEPPMRLGYRQPSISGGERATVTVTANRTAVLRMKLRDEQFHLLQDFSSTIHAGDNAVQIDPLPAGRYWLDLIARDEAGRSLGWGNQVVIVDSPDRLTVTTDRETYRVGDTVEISAEITGPAVMADATATLEIRDALDRAVATDAARAEGSSFHFSYPIADARVAPHRATVTVESAGALRLRAAAQFYVPAHGWDDYQTILWPSGVGSPANITLRNEGGFSGVMDSYGGEDRSRMAARKGFAITRMNDAFVDPAAIQTSPAQAFTRSDAQLTQAIAAAKRYGALAWTLQDERHQLTDPGMPDAEGLRRFRSYLAQRYDTLAALNTSWDTHYRAWEEIEPTLTKDLAGDVSNLAPWVDFRLYVADQEFRADKRHADMIRAALGPETFIGLDGFTTGPHTIPYGAIDFGRLITEGVFNFYCPYGDDLLVASLVRGPTVRYLGWSQPRKTYFSQPWRDAFRGDWGTYRFFGPTFYSGFGWLQPAGRWTAESTRELRAGIGKLLMGSQRQLSPVVILYSYASMVTLAGAERWPMPAHSEPLWRAANASRNTFEQMLLGNGVSFGYQTDSQIAAGSLRDKKLLIIPELMGLALSRATCRAIEQFVNDGGIVLADMAPAAADEHGNLRAGGGLNNLFGITRDRLEHGSQQPDYFAGVTQGDDLLPEHEWYIDRWYEKAIRVVDGSARGKHFNDGTPAFIVKRTGRGRTLLLNFLLDAQVNSDIAPEANQYALMGRVLQSAKVAPIAGIENDSGVAQTNCEVNQLNDGANQYVGFYAQRAPEHDSEHVVARFDRARETYDVRAGKYLGKLQAVPLRLRDAEAMLLARLDYRVTGVTLTAQPAKRGQPIELAIAVATTAPPGRQVVHVDVAAPDGTRSTIYSRNVEVDDGHGHLRLYVALNEPAGAWHLTATEVVSGLSAETDVVLE